MSRWGWIGTLALVVACSSAEGTESAGDTDGDESTSSPTTGTEPTTSPASTASMSGASASVTSAGSDPSTSDDSGSDDAGFINPETSDSNSGGGPQPNGAQCGGNDDCESGFCYSIPMIGGVCSECLTDDDCEFSCALDAAAGYAICSDGSTGVMCEMTESCADGLVCAELIDTGGIFPANFCSECETDADCGDDICSPIYDLMNVGGYLGCVEAGSVADGGGCPIDDTGMGDGTVCTNGHCGIADVFGVVSLGLCGDCTEDTDCTEPDTCMPATVGMSGASGPMCG